MILHIKFFDSFYSYLLVNILINNYQENFKKIICNTHVFIILDNRSRKLQVNICLYHPGWPIPEVWSAVQDPEAEADDGKPRRCNQLRGSTGL